MRTYIILKIFLKSFFHLWGYIFSHNENKILFIYLGSYVDAYRMVAVQVGGSSDLKNIIQQSGMKLNMTDMNPGEPNDETFVKQVILPTR